MVDDRLEDVLTSVGHYLVIGPGVDVGAGAAIDVAPPSGRSRRRLLAAAAIIVGVVAGAIGSVPPARRAVGGWLHVGRIEVSVDPNVTIDTGLPAFLDGAVPLDPEEVVTILGQAPPDLAATSLGSPTGWWTVPEGGVVVTWNNTETSLWILPIGPNEEENVAKRTSASGSVTTTWIPDLGDGGIAISGEHLMETDLRTLVAGAVVAWDDGGVTFRLESTIDIDELVLIARSISASWDVG